MVIETSKRFSYAQGMIFFIILLSMMAMPFSSSALNSPTNDQESAFEGEKPWWEDWQRDLDKNKIDDALEWHIAEENLGSEKWILVVIDYDHRPLQSDVDRLKSFGWNVTYVCKFVDSIHIELPISEIEIVASWEDVVMVEFAPEGRFTLSSALPSINVPQVWQQFGYDGEGITIAIIDTGIDDEHVGLDDLDDDPLTDDPKVIAFYDSQHHPNQDDGTYEPYDDHGHGSHCAGIAAGTGAPNYNHIGVAPKAKLVGVKIGHQSIPYNAAIRGVEWAIANKDKFGIDILSNSWGLILGGPAYQNGESELSRLMDTAVEAGLVVFVSAGNTALSMTVYTPGDSNKAITVGSVNDDHMLSIFSSQGPTADGRIKPDICAVGESVSAPRANSGTGYVSYDGTSMACPMAAGLAALMLQANPGLEPDDVKQILHETSEHNTDARFPASPNNGFGWGVVESYGAVKRARDLSMTFLSGPSKIHERDFVNFITNTTYTRTLYTYKGEDGMTLLGDDVIFFKISVPAVWTIPFNITVTSEGNMSPTIFYSMPRLEGNMWVLEAEFHYINNVIEPTDAIPMVLFQSRTPFVGADTNYTFFVNITLNNMNATKIVNNITVDNQDPPIAIIESPGNSDPVSGIVSILGSAYDPDVGDFVETVEVKINNGNWQFANGTLSWYLDWNTTLLNNGWYTIAARAFDGEEYSSEHNITVYLDNLNIQPWAMIDSVSPNPANEGEEVSFTGHGDDDDGYILNFEWKSNIDGLLSDNHTFSTSTLSVGTHQISFRVKDNDGVWSQKIMINLRINQIPIAYIDSISPNPANEDETVSFYGYGSDDRTILAYNWRSSIDGFLSNLPSFSMMLSLGVHQIYFRVQDDDGVWSEEISQALRINQIPRAFIDIISPNPAIEAEPILFSGHGTDDGNIIAFEWKSSLDGFMSDLNSFEITILSVGDHNISLRVEDNDYVWSEYVFQNLKIKPKPKAFIDSISPNPANEGDLISFSGHGEDVGTIINYNWSSNLDGLLSNSASFNTKSLTPETHTISFRVQNDNNVWSDEVTTLLRINDAPTAYIDSISPNPALIGQDIQFIGHGEDDSGIINYSWSSSLNGFLGNLPSIITDQLSIGDHNIRFKVQDDDFIWSAEAIMPLRIHTKPIAHIESISPNPANEGQETTFIGYGSDDGHIAAYEWFSSIDGFLNDSDTFTTTALSVGEHDISFRVMDNDDVWSDFDILSVRINQIPIASIDSVSPSQANEGTAVTFTGHGTDDRNIVSYNWRSSIDGVLSFSASFTTSYLSPGEHTVYFKVMDDDNVWSQEMSTSLHINGIPIAYIDSISPTHVNEGEAIGFVGHGNDDGNILAYNWTSSLDGLVSIQKEFTANDLSIGNHFITFSVMDNEGTWSVEVFMELRVNQIPKAYIDSISPNPALKDQSIYFVGHGVDDEEIPVYYWSSNLDGYLSNSASFTWFGLTVGEHVMSFRVKDKSDVWSEEKHFLLKIHERPTARIISVSPESPNEEDTISFLGEGIDDGAITAYNWSSDIDGKLGDQEKVSVLLSPGTHYISLTVRDDMGAWSKKATRKLLVNDLPIAFIDSITPNPAEQGEMVTLKGHGVDEGSIVDYEWSSSIDGIIGTESLVSINYLSMGTHNIRFKVKDDNGVWSEKATSSLTVTAKKNTPPSISMITPANGDIVSDMISIEAEAHDEDGRVERIEARIDDYDWFVISDSPHAFYSLQTTDIGEGEHVIYIRAYDGQDYSSEEFVIIRVEQGEREKMFYAGYEFLLISFVILIIIIVLIILSYRHMAKRRGQSSQFIRL